MKTLTFLLIIILLAIKSMAQDRGQELVQVTATSQNLVQDTEKTLEAILKKDQDARKRMMELLKEYNQGNASSKLADSIMFYQEQMNTYDAKNQAQVADILETQGWPENLSASANKAIFLVIDHAELEYQKKYLDLIKEKSEAGVLDKDAYPTLLDRVLMREDKKQIYGTQTIMKTIDGKNITFVWPVENPKNVDSLRSTVGLLPLEIYVEVMKSLIGGEVVWDKNISIEELN